MTSVQPTSDTQNPRLPPRAAHSSRAGQGASVRSGRNRWLVYVTLAEALGFCVPALVGVSLAQRHVAQSLELLLLPAAGAVEGALLGLGQALAWPVRLNVRRYALLTAIGASLAWASIMGVVQLGSLPSVPASVVASSGVVAGLFALLALGSLQWLELRRRVPRAHRFIGWTALAWLVALPISFAPSPFVDEHTPASWLIALWSVSGLLMAFVMALITWRGVESVLSDAGHTGSR